MRIYLLGMIFILAGCGSGRNTRTVEYVPVPGPGQPPPSTTPPGTAGDKPSYPEMQALLNNYCAACHSSNPFMQSESALRGSGAKNKIFTGQMPPANAQRKLPDREKSLMLRFF